MAKTMERIIYKGKFEGIFRDFFKFIKKPEIGGKEIKYERGIYESETIYHVLGVTLKYDLTESINEGVIITAFGTNESIGEVEKIISEAQQKTQKTSSISVDLGCKAPPFHRPTRED